MFRVNATICVPLITRGSYYRRFTIETVRFAKRPDDRQLHDKSAKTTYCAAYQWW